MEQIKNNIWLLISMIFLGGGAIGLWFVLNFILCAQETSTCTSFQKFTTSMVEITIGIGIALIIHDHTRKIQKKENSDLDLTIQDTYYHLWSLYETLHSYIISDKVRAEYSSSLQILNLLSTSQANISKCGRRLDADILSNLQLHLILIQKAISISIDPRGDIEKYWMANAGNVETAFNNIKDIAKNTFEPHINNKQRMSWKKID